MRSSHSACVVVFKKNSVTQAREFLVIEYQATSGLTGELSEKEVRFVAGTNKDHPDETPEETATRKLLEETGLIAWRVRRIDKDPLHRGHVKYAFLVDFEECGGKLYTGSHKRKGDIMSAPFWKPAAELDGGVIAPVHQWAYDAAWEEVCV